VEDGKTFQTCYSLYPCINDNNEFPSPDCRRPTQTLTYDGCSDAALGIRRGKDNSLTATINGVECRALPFEHPDVHIEDSQKALYVAHCDANQTQYAVQPEMNTLTGGDTFTCKWQPLYKPVKIGSQSAANGLFGRETCSGDVGPGKPPRLLPAIAAIAGGITGTAVLSAIATRACLSRGKQTQNQNTMLQSLPVQLDQSVETQPGTGNVTGGGNQSETPLADTGNAQAGRRDVQPGTGNANQRVSPQVGTDVDQSVETPQAYVKQSVEMAGK
jgi:hypothetical protein